MSARWIVAAALLLLPSAAPAQERMAGFLREEYSCIMCHTDKRQSFLLGVHAQRGITCVDCHGGDRTAFERATAHAGDYRGALTKVEAVRLCLGCHSDFSRMRQYGLTAVTRDEFLVSRHGQRLLAAGDTMAPSCGDCHGSHAIFRRDDARSMINYARVDETCARCHADPDRMPADEPTDQFARWEESAHGVALTERHNSRAATCASCHGAHSALPPGVSEVANVCGKCHTLVRDVYLEGPHGPVASGVACTACHSNHGTEVPRVGEIRGLCAGCHAEGTPPDVTGLQLQEQLAASERELELASEAIAGLERAGQTARDERARFLTLVTYLRQQKLLLHSLDPERVGEFTRRVASLSAEIRERHEIVAEHRWERRLLVIPLWLWVLGGVALAVRKRRLLARSDAGGAQRPDVDQEAP